MFLGDSCNYELAHNNLLHIIKEGSGGMKYPINLNLFMLILLENA